MPVSLLRRTSAAAFATYRGQSFYSQNAMKITPDLKPWDVEADATPPVDSRMGGNAIKSSWINVGSYTDAALAVTHPYASFRKGQLNTPVRTVAGVAGNVLNIPKHGQITGTGVVVVSTGTVPTGLTSNTLYYVIVVDADHLSLATTPANALVPTPIVLTDAGTGTIKVVQNSPLIINYLDEDQTQVVLWNTAVTKMPSLILRPTKTMFGELEFGSYCRHGMSISDDDSLFTIGNWTGDAPAIDPTTIPSVQWDAAFGGSAPFDALAPRDGVQVDFEMKLDELKDNDEVVAHRITDVRAMIKLLPLNLLASDLWGELLLQGMGAGLGQSMPKNTLTLSGPGGTPWMEFYGAALQDGPLVISAKEDPIAEVNFKTTQTFTGSAVNPVFFLGTAAP